MSGIALAGVAGAWAFGHATDLGSSVVLLGPVALYNRMNRGATLDNGTRRRIFEYVKRMPGACIADVATHVGVSHSTASYHLDKLHGFNLVTGTTDGNKVRFFVNAGAFTGEERRVLSVLANVETRRVLLTILRHPWSYRAELTTLLGVSSPTVNWHLERLASCGLVQETQSGRSRRLVATGAHITRLLGELLEKLAGTGYDTRGILDVLGACGRAPAVKPVTPGPAET